MHIMKLFVSELFLYTYLTECEYEVDYFWKMENYFKSQI